MDNATHTLVGLMLSRAGLHRWHHRPDLILMVSANVPDIDIVAAAGGSLFYFEQHRGITHSLAMVPAMALLPALVACAVSRSMRGWRAAWGLSVLGVLSHLLLDLTNSYGVRLFSPFNGAWLRLDLNFIVDLWVWAVFLFALAGPWLSRLVSSEIGAKPGSGRGLAIFALSFLVVYDFGRYLSHERALAKLNARMYQGAIARRVAAFPAGSNPFAWIGWVDGNGFSSRFNMNLLAEFDPTGGTTFQTPEPTPAIEAAKGTEPFQAFLRWAQFPYWIMMPMDDPEGATQVELKDGRFNFGAVAIVDKSNRVQRGWFHY